MHVSALEELSVLEMERDTYHSLKVIRVTVNGVFEHWKREGEDYKDDINLHKV